MPRVANLPRAGQGQIASPQKHASIKIPLNDDRQEKAIRLQSRQALYDLQMNQIKAAASPIRNQSIHERTENSLPHTPGRPNANEKENFENGGALTVMTGTAVTPMKRVPILANFEEWMKMATDNKINATNSWNFALIDYFHDMSLLKEGDGVNFQKASCTLDGCVKIYTSRVDSVATETGKLLSGLADSGKKRDKGGVVDGEDGENLENEEDEEGIQKKAKKRRSFEATLAPSFAPLSLKKFELEFSVDPLFKKASADFDEGGAKGLLLNHLAIDAQGRIVFDSSDDSEGLPQTTNINPEENSDEKNKSLAATGNEQALRVQDDILSSNVDISVLGSKFFPDLDRLDRQDICPSLKNLNFGESSRLSGLAFLKAPEDWRHEKDAAILNHLSERSGIFLDDDNAAGFDDDNDAFDVFNEPVKTGFGEGGEAWARDAALEPQICRIYGADSAENFGEAPNLGVSEQVPAFSVTGPVRTISTHRSKDDTEHANILSYFDNALQKNWAGPEHWKIRKMKGIASATPCVPIKRKEKEVFQIDFVLPLSTGLADLVYSPASSNSTISLPKATRVSKTRNLLPDDKHFNSRQLVQLFLKPNACVGTRWPSRGNRRAELRCEHEKTLYGNVDENFWANQNNTAVGQDPEGIAPAQGHYDADFFQDDGLGFAGGPPEDDDFADARETFSPGLDVLPLDGPAALGDMIINHALEGTFGSQLVTQSRKSRPDYVQYARVAKKVDVRRLKQEMWKGLAFEANHNAMSTLTKVSLLDGDDHSLSRFTSLMNSLQQVYPQSAMADISTSYCFICLLHLANEKGLTIADEEGLEELSIRRDFTAEITESTSRTSMNYK